ncbi:hypothetical protein BFP71_09510 [Roseivirga misakiensis]|uniref:Uncharacterized protein n=2 Tax=Roseivirga misakiensis TaxID=1563681 RepID=A0A1E5SKY8_9BACT|nr:hypothetical protein BFP71_09510 [Roseivirga misakiensis]
MEDYRFQQITHRMRQINFHFDRSLDLMGIIAGLMHQDPSIDNIPWLHEYAEGLEQVYQADFWNEGQLEAIAILSYDRLKTL